MPLPFREWLAMLVPPSYFYRRRIAEEARSGEPELAVLTKLVPSGGCPCRKLNPVGAA